MNNRLKDIEQFYNTHLSSLYKTEVAQMQNESLKQCTVLHNILTLPLSVRCSSLILPLSL